MEQTVVRTLNPQKSRRALFRYFLISLVINSVGNGLTVSLNMGSAPWTAACANLANVTGLRIGLTLLLIGLIVIATNCLLLHKVYLRRVVGNLLFMIPFSLLVDLTSMLFKQMHLGALNIYLKCLLDFGGICLIAIAVSIYQRVNWILHPNDDLVLILRFHYFHGNPKLAQWVSFLPTIFITGLVFGLTRKIVAVNVGTLFSLLFQGGIIGWADHHVFKKLLHRESPLI